MYEGSCLHWPESECNPGFLGPEESEAKWKVVFIQHDREIPPGD